MKETSSFIDSCQVQKTLPFRKSVIFMDDGRSWPPLKDFISGFVIRLNAPSGVKGGN